MRWWGGGTHARARRHLVLNNAALVLNNRQVVLNNVVLNTLRLVLNNLGVAMLTQPDWDDDNLYPKRWVRIGATIERQVRINGTWHRSLTATATLPEPGRRPLTQTEIAAATGTSPGT